MTDGEVGVWLGLWREFDSCVGERVGSSEADRVDARQKRAERTLHRVLLVHVVVKLFVILVVLSLSLSLSLGRGRNCHRRWTWTCDGATSWYRDATIEPGERGVILEDGVEVIPPRGLEAKVVWKQPVSIGAKHHEGDTRTDELGTTTVGLLVDVVDVDGVFLCQTAKAESGSASFKE